MNRKLKITLYVIAAYLTVFGVLFLFAPRVAEKVMSTTLPDAALNLLYGQLTLTFAYVAFMAARSTESNSGLSRAVLALTAGHVVIFAYLLLSGILGFPQVGPPLIVNLIFTVLLFVFRR